MEIRCTHCRKTGRVWFERTTVYPEHGPALDVIRCLNCSQWIKSRPIAPEPTVRRSAPAKSRETRRRQKANRLSGVRAQCLMPGCTHSYLLSRNKFGLCRDHGAPLHAWLSHRRRRGKAGTPPVALVNGQWIKRGHPLPGISTMIEGDAS